MTKTTTASTYAYCDREHPGSDAEARDWHDRYHSAVQGPTAADGEYPTLDPACSDGRGWTVAAVKMP